MKTETTLQSEQWNYIKGQRPIISLNDFCETHDLIPEVIKIDVEGSEIHVLKGAKDTLTKHKFLVFLSVHPTEIFLMGQYLDDLFKIIEEVDYEEITIEGQPIQEFALDEYLMRPKI